MAPFWKKSLEEFSEAEWEALCDGCGKCCTASLVDEDEGIVLHTDIACRLLDRHSCGCTDYQHRFERVPDCTRVSPDNIHQLTWLPDTCAYRLIARGKDLPAWHYLVCGDRDRVHQVGISVQDRVTSEADFEGELEDRVIAWFSLEDQEERTG